MGDRYILNKNCSYCNELNEEIWFAPTSNSIGFFCSKCKKFNFINDEFNIIKPEELTLEIIENTISFASNMMTKIQIKRMAKQTFEQMKIINQEVKNV